MTTSTLKHMQLAYELQRPKQFDLILSDPTPRHNDPNQVALYTMMTEFIEKFITYKLKNDLFERFRRLRVRFAHTHAP